ncbi:hypothetical protein BH23ACT8_BH23ACT8_24640 [soil metagenome]
MLAAPGPVHAAWAGPWTRRPIVFPSYDGNRFVSLGNMTADARAGPLFIDSETGKRLLVRGTETSTPTTR